MKTPGMSRNAVPIPGVNMASPTHQFAPKKA